MVFKLTTAGMRLWVLSLALAALIVVLLIQGMFQSPKAGDQGSDDAGQMQVVPPPRQAAPNAGCEPSAASCSPQVQRTDAGAKADGDCLTGAVDPYNERAQWIAFLAAAGPDEVLTAREFANDAKRGAGFARQCDRWSEILEYDKDNSGTIDWAEARAYRTALRASALEAFDTNNDGTLTGEEREAALAAMSSREDPVASSQTGTDIEEGLATRPAIRPANEAARREFLDRYGKPSVSTDAVREFDKNGDGVLSGDELRQAKADRDRRMLKAYDFDGDGRLSRKERFAARMDIIRESERLTLEKYDANHNGVLDADELAKQKQDSGLVAAQP